MLKNKAHIAQEQTPVDSEIGSAFVMCVRAHNLLPPPPPIPRMKILDPRNNSCKAVAYLDMNLNVKPCH